ncbi:MAG: hypothetical protein LBG94_09585 [Treponema sp.]|nr:hypothetical protein [Treponema sp.]
MKRKSKESLSSSLPETREPRETSLAVHKKVTITSHSLIDGVLSKIIDIPLYLPLTAIIIYSHHFDV